MTMLVTVAEVRAEGVTSAMVGDPRLTAAIEAASDFVERYCGVPFHVVTYTLGSPLVLDGPRRQAWPTLHLPMPILTLTGAAPMVNGAAGTAYLLSGIKVFNRRDVGMPGDRLNPKLVRDAGWPQGELAVALAGTFGWTDLAPDPADTTPPIAQIERAPSAVRRAVMLMVINDFAPLLGNAAAQDERLRRWLVSETTEGHSYSLDAAARGNGPTGLWEADRLLNGYRRPIQVRA